MDDAALVDACNLHMTTEDGTPITTASSFFQAVLKNNVLLHNHSQAEILVQAFVGRYLMHSGEKMVISLANKRVKRREHSTQIQNTLLEMMLVVTIVTMAYVLVKLHS